MERTGVFECVRALARAGWSLVCVVCSCAVLQKQNNWRVKFGIVFIDGNAALFNMNLEASDADRAPVI
jgi:hypothetical protein